MSGPHETSVERTEDVFQRANTANQTTFDVKLQHASAKTIAFLLPFPLVPYGDRE